MLMRLPEPKAIMKIAYYKKESSEIVFSSFRFLP